MQSPAMDTDTVDTVDMVDMDMAEDTDMAMDMDTMDK